MRKVFSIYSTLIAINMLYACVTIFTKYASSQEILSVAYFMGLTGAIGVMGVYAICWQQVLKRVNINMAYMFKGTSLIFVMLLAFSFFDEQITRNNIIGACLIILGIVVFAKE